MKRFEPVHLLPALAGVVFGLALVESLALFHLLDFRDAPWLSPDHFDEELLSVHRPHLRSSGSGRGGAVSALYKIPDSDLSVYTWDNKYDHNGFRNTTDLTRADI